MKLITKEIEALFEAHPFGSQDELGFDAKVLVKYFNPCGAGTWLITEAEKQEEKYRELAEIKVSEINAKERFFTGDFVRKPVRRPVWCFRSTERSCVNF